VKVEKALFKVIGMYCTTCKPIVEKQLKDEEAVKKIDIDYMTDSVIVEFDPSIITKKEIKNTLEKSGYKFVRTAGKWVMSLTTYYNHSCLCLFILLHSI
jgi:copper chaperone